MPSGPSLLNDRLSVQIAPFAAFSWIDMSIAMPSVGWIGPWTALALTIGAAALVREQVDGVRGVVPQQVVGPAARLAERVHVAAAEEVRLHVHLLDLEFAGDDALVHELVARVEAARVAAHRHAPRRLLRLDDGLRVLPRIGERDLDLHVLAGLQAGDGLRSVHLRRRAQDHRVDFGQREAVGQVGADVADAVPGGDLAGLLELAAHQRHHLDAVDVA